jgi:hypothetical protein
MSHMEMALECLRTEEEEIKRFLLQSKGTSRVTMSIFVAEGKISFTELSIDDEHMCIEGSERYVWVTIHNRDSGIPVPSFKKNMIAKRTGRGHKIGAVGIMRSRIK